MERVGERQEKLGGHCSTGQSPQGAVAPMEEEEEVDAHFTIEKRLCRIANLFIFLRVGIRISDWNKVIFLRNGSTLICSHLKPSGNNAHQW